MPSYLNPLSGSNVLPSDVAYRAVTLSANTTLVWPEQSTSATDYMARLMDVTATAGSLVLTVPDARAQGPGFDTIFNNVGANTFTVKDSAGGTICTVAAGQQQYVYLRTNATAAGTWGVYQLNASSSVANAASLAGYGVAASGGTLQYSQPVTTLSSNTTLDATYRAGVVVWTGGLGTLTLPDTAGVGNDFMVSVANQGTGLLTLQPAAGQTIDGATTLALQLGDSCELHSNGIGLQWYTVGRGRQNTFNFTVLSKTVTTGTYTLTAAEASNVVQQYSGTLVANVIIVVPSTVQVYYVSNNTSGAFSLTLKTAGVGATISIPQGTNAVLFCDGLNVINSATTTAGITALVLNPGGVTSPSITFSGNTNTGIYQPVSNTVAITTAGSEIMRWTTSGFTTPATAVTWSGNPTHSGNHTFSGNVSIGGTLGVTGAITGNLTGNASTATTLATGRTISITGDLTYTSPSFNGSADVSAAGTLATVFGSPGTYGNATNIPTITVNGKGLITNVVNVSVGNATTATALLNTRNINGVGFNGSSNITITAAAGTLTGTTLNGTVTASSLTSVGTLTSLSVSGATGLAATTTTSLSATGNVSLGNSSANTITVNGTPAGQVLGSTYTPTIGAVTNIQTTLAYVMRYVRIGNYVWVNGFIDVDPTNPSVLTEVTLTLPIAGTVSVASDLAGVGAPTSAPSTPVSVVLVGEATGKAKMSFVPPSSANATYAVAFGYRI